MKIWVVAELDSIFPSSGAVVGVFTNEKLARDFIKERKEISGTTMSLTGWDENETILTGERE